MYTSFLFIRHAQSRHNQMTKHLAAKNPGLSIVQLKKTSQYKEQKYCQQLMDASISDTGQYQCKNASKAFADILKQVDVIITSPLKRSLETVDKIFNLTSNQNQKDGNKKIQVIVEPYLTQQVTSSCDIGGHIKQSKQKYGKVMNFQKLPENNEDMWQMNYILPERIRQLVLDQCKSDNNEQGKSIHASILKIMKEEEMQNDADLQLRAGILKKQLREYLNKYKDKRIALVGHSGIFKFLTATNFYEDGTPVNAVALNNAEIQSIPIMLDAEKSSGSSIILCGC